MASPPPNQQATQQAARNTAIAALAASQLAQLWPRVDWGSQAAASAVRTLFGAIVQRYGRSAAAVSAQAYDELRATKNLPTRYRAVPAAPASDAHLDRVVESAFLGHDTAAPGAQTSPPIRARNQTIRWSEQPADATTSDLIVEERVPRRLDAALSRLVLQPARDTIANNADQDPAKPTWIRVPTGTYTCEFCMMLASRELGKSFSGYADAHNALFRANGTLFHRECDCVAWPVYPGDDPHLISPNMRDYQRVYHKATANAGTHGDMKTILAEMRKVNKAEDPEYTSRRRQNVSGPAPSAPTPARGGGSGGGGDKPPRPPIVVGQPPFGEDAQPPEINAGHILDGESDNPSSGGHRFGTGRPNKTEFPRNWPDDKIIAGVQHTMSAPELTIHGGDRTDYLAEVDGVVIRVSTYLRDGVRIFRTAYPVNGNGVVYNRPDGATEPRPLNRDVIESYRRQP